MADRRPYRHRRFNLKVTLRTIDLGSPPVGVYVIVTVALSLPRFARMDLVRAVGASVTTIRPPLVTVRCSRAITTVVLLFRLVCEAPANCVVLALPTIWSVPGPGKLSVSLTVPCLAELAIPISANALLTVPGGVPW